MVTFPAETWASRAAPSHTQLHTLGELVARTMDIWCGTFGDVIDEKKVTLYLLDKLTLSGLFKLIDLIFCNYHAYNLVGLIKAFGNVPRCCVYGDLN